MKRAWKVQITRDVYQKLKTFSCKHNHSLYIFLRGDYITDWYYYVKQNYMLSKKLIFLANMSANGGERGAKPMSAKKN